MLLEEFNKTDIYVCHSRWSNDDGPYFTAEMGQLIGQPLKFIRVNGNYVILQKMDGGLGWSFKPDHINLYKNCENNSIKTETNIADLFDFNFNK